MTFTPAEWNANSKVVRHMQNISITRPFTTPNTSTTVLFDKEGKIAKKWDGWPDGFFEHDFTFHEVDNYNNLQVHWATKTHGHHGGFDSADSWEQGKKQHRECLSIIKCDNPDCLITIQPQMTQVHIKKQLLVRCKCGAVLDHMKCDVKSFTWTYLKRVHFVNAGFHQHPLAIFSTSLRMNKFDSRLLSILYSQLNIVTVISVQSSLM